jgi:hypothetical protein
MNIDRDTARVALVLCSAIPFLFFWHARWMPSALLGYLLTALLFGVALVGEYPPLFSGWFWRAIVPIVIIHFATVFGLVWFILKISFINRMPRALYGFAAIILVAEWRLSLRIIGTFERP